MNRSAIALLMSVMACAAWAVHAMPAGSWDARAREVSNVRAARSARCRTDLDAQLAAQDVPGLAAAIVKGDRILCTAAAGTADFDQHRPVTPDTLFLIASVSKLVTATALMQLYERGKFRLGDDINHYLPFRITVPQAPDSPITFRQLLTHTGSIDDNDAIINCPGTCNYGSRLGAMVTRGADSPILLADFIRGYFEPGGVYYDSDENFQGGPPGTIYDYSNMGFVLIGYLVETIAGMPFDRYCDESIFKPLGMQETSWRLAGIDRSLLAMPYDKAAAGWVAYGHYGEPDYPDGMLRTSVNELARFLLAFMQGGSNEGAEILGPATVQEMLRSQTALEKSQGLGWMRRTLDGRTLWGHDGSDNGATAAMWFDPEAEEGVILFSNGVTTDEGPLLVKLIREAARY
jgi:CubicO group peptidase (beta-lactamase class C family)